MWDPDGAGPASPRLVLAGDFTVAGPVLANRIVAYDLATGVWSAPGSGMDQTVRALAVLPNGQPAAAGSYVTVDGQVGVRFARYATPCPASAPTAGALDAQSALPNSPALAGVALRNQGVMMGFTAGLQFAQSTSANALAATVGSF